MMNEDEAIRALTLRKHPRIRRIMGFLLKGLAAILPVMGTVWLLVLIYKVLLKVGDVIISRIIMILNGFRWYLRDRSMSFHEWDFDFIGSNFVRFLIPVFLLLLIGCIVASKPGHRFLHLMDQAMQRIPYLGYIYSALKQFVDAVKDLGGERKFQSVAYVEFPRPGCRMLSFVTGNYHDPQTGRDVTTVFIPTSPNPMTGFVIIVDDDKVEDSEMSLEEATKMILSAGLVAPASYADES
jgi:uncharacterized membrane protein